jgi:hypothetical protein
MQLRESRNISTKTNRLEGDPMKNLKKFAALLLAGAMALLMLPPVAAVAAGPLKRPKSRK